MRMLAALVPAFIIVSTWSPMVHGQTAAAEATPAVEFGSGKVDLPAGETTEVKGQIPVDLTGLWLVSENHELPARVKTDDKRFYPSVQVYRISKAEDGALVVNWIEYTPPEAVRAKLGEAQRGQKPWTVADEDVAAIVAQVAAAPPAIDPRRRGMHVVSTPAEFLPKVKESPESKGARFAVQSLFQPDDRPIWGQSYYFREVGEKKMSGTMTMGAVPQNVSGAPMPIGTRGEFVWIRLDTPPAEAAAKPVKP